MIYENRICAYSKCAKRFHPNSKEQRFCSVSCGARHRCEEGEPKERVCQNPKCRKRFFSSVRVKYCSDKCMKKICTANVNQRRLKVKVKIKFSGRKIVRLGMFGI